MKKPLIVVVDGIIGAGKTSYLEVLEKDLAEIGLKVVIVKEPVEKWETCGILQRFYDDPKRWAYHFQCKAFHDRVLENIQAYEQNGNTPDLYILERSCFTDNLFMEMLHESHTIDDLELQHYREWWKLWARIMPYLPDIFVYLKPDINTCMLRLYIRNRTEESNIPREYQIALEKKHDEFFKGDFIDLSDYVHDSTQNTQNATNISSESRPKIAKVLKIKTNKAFRDDLEARKEIVDQFLGFCGLLS